MTNQLLPVDLRRDCFEGMHPTAKLFNFDDELKLYVGDGVEKINMQWTTWCACVGMFYLEHEGDSKELIEVA